MKIDGLIYCDKCGKELIMSFTCEKCGRIVCDTCGKMTSSQPEQHIWGTSQMLGGNKPECPFCCAAEQSALFLTKPVQA